MKIALVTGASGVIGGACAKALAAKGYALALQYHSHPERAGALLHALSSDTPILLQSADISRNTDVSKLFRAIDFTFTAYTRSISASLTSFSTFCRKRC